MGGTVSRIDVGRNSCAILDTGALRCWGWGLWGVLGYGNEDNIGDDETPASVGDVDVGSDVAQISAGTCALLEPSHEVRCWGSGLHGRLGYGNTDDVGDDETPASVGSVPL